MPQAYFGVMERFSTYSAVIFSALLGVYAFRYFGMADTAKEQKQVTD